MAKLHVPPPTHPHTHTHLTPQTRPFRGFLSRYQDKAYWLAMSKSVLATNEAAEAMAVVGIGLEAYYNPLFPPFFKCIYKVKKSGNAS